MSCDHFHSIDSQVKLIAYLCTRLLREQDGKYVTNQIPCVESVSDENLLSSVQRWELHYSHR